MPLTLWSTLTSPYLKFWGGADMPLLTSAEWPRQYAEHAKAVARPLDSLELLGARLVVVLGRGQLNLAATLAFHASSSQERVGLAADQAT